MKILYLNSLYFPHIAGGAEISLQHIVEGIKHKGHDVVVVSLSPDSKTHLDVVNNVKVYRVPLNNLYWPYSVQRPGKYSKFRWHIKDRRNKKMATLFQQILIEENPDLISCHNLSGWSISVWGIIKQLNIPIVQVLHDFYLLCPSGNMFKNNQSCIEQCKICKILRNGHVRNSVQVDAVVAISKFVLDRFIQFGYFEKARQYVIHNVREIEKRNVRVLNFKNNRPLIFGFIGTLSPSKGLEWLIGEFERIDGNMELKIAGSGQKDYEESLKRLVTKSNVEFLGFKSPEEFYSKVDVVIVPSCWEEPLGMVAVEACAYDLPVIASYKGGLKEIIKDELNGLICYSDKPESLGDAIEKMYNNPQLIEKLSLNARASVSEMLDKNRLVTDYENVYKEFV